MGADCLYRGLFGMKHLVAPLAPLALAACALTPPAEAPAPLRGESAVSTQSALALLPVLDAEAGPAANLFYSPASIEQAFGVLRLGAAGETRAQLEAVLPPPKNPAGLASKGGGVEVRLANALWLSDAFRFRPAFLAEAAREYRATAERVNVARPAEVAGRVNAWAARATEGLIPQVLSPQSVTSDTVAFVTNALYFDGFWQTPFNGFGDEPFLFGDGSERKFRLMREVLTVPVVKSGGLVAARLPYSNPRYAMDVVMPEARVVMKAAPSPESLAAIGKRLGEAKPVLAEVRLPQFEIDYAKGLVPYLQRIGLTLPFDASRADLSVMAEPGQRPLVVDDVQHIAKLQVFDTGTRAAAVTTMRIVLTSARIHQTPPVPFIVDRPFMVVLRDLERGEVLFVGRIANPQPFSPKAMEG
jgi:serine protease inhibitor